MCDWKPGDEVECVNDHDWHERAPRWMFWTRSRPCDGPIKGQRYTVDWVGFGEDTVTGECKLSVVLISPWDCGWSVTRFRKIERRDLKEWLAAKTTIEEPRRTKAPAKKRERAS